MATFNKYNITALNYLNGVYNLGSDALNIALSNASQTATFTVLASITDLTTGGGYTAGGKTVGSTSTSQTGGVATLIGNNVVFTASGGTIGPFEYCVLYDSTVGGGPLLGSWSYGANVTLSSGDTFTVNLSSGIETLT